MISRCLRLYPPLAYRVAYCPMPLGRIVTCLLNQAARLDVRGLTTESATRHSQCLRPKRSGRVGELHHVSNRRHERIELRVGYDEWGSDLQHHEVVSANLRQESEVAKQTHHHDLAEHRRVNGAECLIGNSQAKLPRSLKFNAYQQ